MKVESYFESIRMNKSCIFVCLLMIMVVWEETFAQVVSGDAVNIVPENGKISGK